MARKSPGFKDLLCQLHYLRSCLPESVHVFYWVFLLKCGFFNLGNEKMWDNRNVQYRIYNVEQNIMFYNRQIPKWHTGLAKLSQWQRHIRNWTATTALHSGLWDYSAPFISLCLISMVCEELKSKQGWSYDGTEVSEPYRGPPTGIAYQSESSLTSEGVCSLTRGGLLLTVTSHSQWSWKVPLSENGMRMDDSQKWNKSATFALISQLSILRSQNCLIEVTKHEE